MRAFRIASAIVISLVLAACDGSSNDDSREHSVGLNVDLRPIHALAETASQNAVNMDDHADAMAAAAVGRPDLDHWKSDADTIRAEAQSLRLLADWAKAIQYDPGARSDSSADLQRVLSDGKSLEQLGGTLLTHSSAMQAHLDVMRQQAGGHATLIATLAQLDSDVSDMKQSGQAAVDRGRELQETARRLAQSTGIKIE
jgi:hypothetical protein